MIKEYCTCLEPQPFTLVQTKNYRLDVCYCCKKVIYETPDDEEAVTTNECTY